MNANQFDDPQDVRLRAFLDLRASEVAMAAAPASAVAARLAARSRPARRAGALRLGLVAALLALVALAAALIVAGSRHPTPLASWALARGAAWSPDGSRLAFWALVRNVAGPSSSAGPSAASSRTGPANALYVMNADGSDLRLLDQRPVADLADLVSAADVEWSADDRHLAYSRETAGHRELVLVDAVTADETVLPGPDDAWPVAWSPTADRLLFIRSGPGGSDLYSVASDGTGMKSLTTDHRSFGGGWSPDGSHILYVDGVIDGTQQDDSATWVMAYDGTAKARIGACCDAGWSADGRTAYVDNDGTSLTGLRIADGTTVVGPVQLGSSTGWLLARDGMTLALATDSGLVLRHPDGRMQQLTTDPLDRLLAWSRDGRYLAFDGARTQGSGVYAIAVDGGSPVLVGARATVGGNPWRPGPDGEDRLVFERDRDLYTTRADGSALQRLTSGAGDAGDPGPSAGPLTSRMEIADDGPDRDVYRIAGDGRIHLTMENTTGQPWIVSFPGLNIGRMDCRSTGAVARLASFVDPGAAGSPIPAAMPNVCVIPSHQTVTVDEPFSATGSTTLVVSRLGPDDEPALPGYLVTVDVIEPAAPSGS